MTAPTILTAAAWLVAVFWIIGIPITYRFARLAGEDARRAILWASAWPPLLCGFVAFTVIAHDLTRTPSEKD